MSKRSVVVGGLLIMAMVMIGSVVGATYATSRPTGSVPAARQSEYLCVPDSVAVLGNRIHVHCVFPMGSIQYFAAPLGDANTPQFLSALTAAMTSIPIVELHIGYIDDTTSGPPFGCGADDCRKISYIYLALKEGAPLN
jgi:hypothetical protein